MLFEETAPEIVGTDVLRMLFRISLPRLVLPRVLSPAMPGGSAIAVLLKTRMF
jgi:hypothetical protein